MAAGRRGQAAEAVVAAEHRLGPVVAVLPVIAALPSRQECQHAAAVDARGDEIECGGHLVVGVEGVAAPVHAVQGDDERHVSRPCGHIGARVPRLDAERGGDMRVVAAHDRLGIAGAADAPRRRARLAGHLVRGVFVDELDGDAAVPLHDGEALGAHMVIERLEVQVLAAAEIEEDEGGVGGRRVMHGRATTRHGLTRPSMSQQVTGGQAAHDELRAADALRHRCGDGRLDAVVRSRDGEHGLAGRGALTSGPGELIGADGRRGAVAHDVHRRNAVRVFERDHLERQPPAVDLERRVVEVEAELLHAAILCRLCASQ